MKVLNIKLYFASLKKNGFPHPQPFCHDNQAKKLRQFSSGKERPDLSKRKTRKLWQSGQEKSCGRPKDKKARIHILVFSQSCLVDTPQDANMLYTQTKQIKHAIYKARIKDFHLRHQNVMGAPQKGLLQEEKSEKWRARTQYSAVQQK